MNLSFVIVVIILLLLLLLLLFAPIVVLVFLLNGVRLLPFCCLMFTLRIALVGGAYVLLCVMNSLYD